MSARDEGFESLLRFVEDELGFATSHYDDAYLDRRITARLRRTGAESYGEYRDLIAGDDGEAEALMDSLSVNVTEFFRNDEMWERLRGVLRTLAGGRDGVDLWSAACADGREPYSMAMLALDDDRIDENSVSITATDISEDALAAARRGVYETTRTTDIEEELSAIDGASRYVSRDGDRFEVRDPVSAMVRFRRHDLIRGRPPGEFDLVMCRNLLIYIDPDYEVRVLETIDGALRDGGALVIGMAETLPPGFDDGFDPVERRLRIYRRSG